MDHEKCRWDTYARKREKLDAKQEWERIWAKLEKDKSEKIIKTIIATSIYYSICTLLLWLIVVCIQKVHHGHLDEDDRCAVTWWLLVPCRTQYYLYVPAPSSNHQLLTKSCCFLHDWWWLLKKVCSCHKWVTKVRLLALFRYLDELLI
jgi:hypothetical protein